jgi:hypothetical protein
MRGAAILALILAGCDLVGAARAPGVPVSEAYASGAHELRVLDGEPPLRAERRIPVLSTPEVFAAWVPAHPQGELLVGEHWIFFKLKDSEWFVERFRDPEPPATGDALPEQIRPLRDFDWSRAPVPYKDGDR